MTNKILKNQCFKVYTPHNEVVVHFLPKFKTSSITGFQLCLQCQTSVLTWRASLKSNYGTLGHPPNSQYATNTAVGTCCLGGWCCISQNSHMGMTVDALPAPKQPVLHHTKLWTLVNRGKLLDQLNTDFSAFCTQTVWCLWSYQRIHLGNQEKRQEPIFLGRLHDQLLLCISYLASVVQWQPVLSLV